MKQTELPLNEEQKTVYASMAFSVKSGYCTKCRCVIGPVRCGEDAEDKLQALIDEHMRLRHSGPQMLLDAYHGAQ